MARYDQAFTKTSRDAVRYAVRELGRRAGASADWIATWRVQCSNDSVYVYPESDSDARIAFPFDPTKPARLAELRMEPPTHYRWMHAPHTSLAETIPDFIVLFEDQHRDGEALFEASGERSVQCHADLLTSALWTLSRMEEIVPLEVDEHGRFPATASTAYRAGCLDRPIVDECGLAFQQALLHLFPRWTPPQRPLRVKLSHDMDRVGIPRRFRTTVGHIYTHNMPKAFVRDVLSAVGLGLPAYLQAVLRVADTSHTRGLDSAMYWKASGVKSERDTGYDLFHPLIRSTIERLMDQGFEMGLHPAYTTFGSNERLSEELSTLRKIVGSQPVGGRYHYLRWNPAAWRAWEDVGLAYDSTLGFADCIGFRAGTAVPYHPWMIEEDRELAVLEIPLVVMDCTPIAYMHLDEDQTLRDVDTLIRRCETTGGVFTLLWHNVSVLEQPYAQLYPRILDLLPRNSRYEWKDDLAIGPLPQAVGETMHA